MQLEAANSTLNYIDLSINKSIDFITTTFRQLFQLIFCFLLILVVGKIINFFTLKTQHAENESNSTVKEEIDSEIEPEASNEEQKEPAKEPTGWDSEPIKDSLVTALEIPSSNVTAKTMKKQFRRKCMSVGPIMLTPNSQIIRTLDYEEREERFRYDILPLDSTTIETATAENVCVPCWFCNRFILLLNNFESLEICNEQITNFFLSLLLFTLYCQKENSLETPHVHNFYF